MSRQENINQNGTNTNNSSFQGHQQQNQTIQAIPTQNISPNIPYASGVVLTEPQRSQNLIPTVHATILPAVEVDAYAYAVVFEDRQPQTQMAVPTAVAYYSHAQAYPVNDDQQPTPTTSNESEFGMGNLHLCEE